MFVECDLSLLEINPLVVTKEGNLLCLDGKINIDDNAFIVNLNYEQCVIPHKKMNVKIARSDWELNYIALDGNIGCMVNGAGLGHGNHGCY